VVESMIYAYLSKGRHKQIEQPLPPAAEWWIRFDPDKHTYTDSDGIEYVSCTRFVASMDDAQFNPLKMSIQCASKTTGKYAGMYPDEIQAQWKDTAVAGSELHAAIEASINGTWRKSHSRKLHPLVEQFETWRRLSLPDLVKAERIFWSRRYRIAGMFDVVSWSPTDGLQIDDVKTYAYMSSDRKKHASRQITLGVLMVEESLMLPAKVGGIILFENYYTLRRKARLTYVPCKDQREQIQPYLWARDYHVRQEEEAMAIKLAGKIGKSCKKVVLYGTEGVGKSTFGSRFPDPIVLDTEGSTIHMDELDDKRLPSASSWNMAQQLLSSILAEPTPLTMEGGYKPRTLIIDTFDWLERVGAEHVAKSKGKNSIADIGYGKGELALASETKGILDVLSEIQAKHKLHIVLLCHAWVKHFDPPDLPDGFDRHEMKLTKHVAPLVREWCDMLLFANFVSTYNTNDDGKTKGVGDGTERVMYATRTDAHDAKNRFNLDAVLPFAYKNIAHIIEGAKQESK